MNRKMSDPDGDETWGGPAFRPGWPDIFPLSLIVARTSVRQRHAAPDAEHGVSWALHVATRQDSPRLAFMGDLTVSSELNFGGVTVVMPFVLRIEPEVIGEEERDAILRQYGEWVSGLIYDHAAMALRAALAGNGLPLEVPYGTPEVELHTSDIEHPRRSRGKRRRS
jgi:hypothetical protein